MIDERPATLAASARETIRHDLRIQSVPLALPVPFRLKEYFPATGEASGTQDFYYFFH